VGFLSKLKQKANKLKAEALILVEAYKDKRTPLMAKILIGFTVGYLLSPIDLIPDFIPFLGQLDDVIIVPVLIALSIKLIPDVVLKEAREIVDSNPIKLERKNWLFAGVIIIIWVIAIFYTYRLIRYFAIGL
jgi:uncharacterized membrane protein YkvA (DUF1232 family)